MAQPPVPRPPPGAPPMQKRPGGHGVVRGMPPESETGLAMAAHVLVIPTSFIGPLVLWSLKRQDSEFIAYHAAQAFWFGIASLLALTFSCGMASMILPLLWVYSLYMGLRAKEGEWAGYPAIDRWGYERKLL